MGATPGGDEDEVTAVDPVGAQRTRQTDAPPALGDDERSTGVEVGRLGEVTGPTRIELPWQPPSPTAPPAASAPPAPTAPSPPWAEPRPTDPSATKVELPDSVRAAVLAAALSSGPDLTPPAAAPQGKATLGGGKPPAPRPPPPIPETPTRLEVPRVVSEAPTRLEVPRVVLSEETRVEPPKVGAPKSPKKEAVLIPRPELQRRGAVPVTRAPPGPRSHTALAVRAAQRHPLAAVAAVVGTLLALLLGLNALRDKPARVAGEEPSALRELFRW